MGLLGRPSADSGCNNSQSPAAALVAATWHPTHLTPFSLQSLEAAQRNGVSQCRAFYLRRSSVAESYAKRRFESSGAAPKKRGIRSEKRLNKTWRWFLKKASPLQGPTKEPRLSR